jgi:type VI secretion system secreted protein VgrG
MVSFSPSVAPPNRPVTANLRVVLGFLGLALGSGHATHAQTILGSTGNYAVMAGSTVTINGTGTTITGDLGAAGITGAGYTLTGATVSPITAQNETDFTRAFGGLAGMTPTANLSGMTLGTTTGAVTLTPGVYKFDATAQLTGNLILDAQNQANAVWVFQIGTTFTTAASAAVTFTNLAANSVATNGLFWQIGSTTTVGAGTTLKGNFLGGTTFNFGSGATISEGRALTGTGTITLDTANNAFNFIGASSGYSGGLAFVDSGNTLTAVPEPSTYALFAGAAALAVVALRRRMPRPAANGDPSL